MRRWIQAVLAATCVAAVWIGPLFLPREERWLNLVPVFSLVTVPVVFVCMSPFVGSAVFVLVARRGLWPPWSTWIIALAVAVVGTLPGMVGVHRHFFAWYSYHRNVPLSLACIIVIVVVSTVRVTVQAHRQNETLCQALIAASIVNAAFPWWPLD